MSVATGPKLWSVNALATEFQKDRRTVAKRLEEVEPSKEGKWLLRDAAPAILGITALDPTQQKAALDEARTKKLELEIERMEGRSLDAEEARQALAAMNSRIRARLSAVAGAQAGRANPEDPRRAEVAIADGINDALAELADDIFGSGAATETSAEANGGGVGRHIPAAEFGVELGSGEMED